MGGKSGCKTDSAGISRRYFPSLNIFLEGSCAVIPRQEHLGRQHDGRGHARLVEDLVANSAR